MIDPEKRETIIREFERFVQEYKRDIGFTSYDEEVLDSVLAILKEQKQKPVAPKLALKGKNKNFSWYRCECGELLYYEQSYCIGCGREMKWE